MSADRYYDTIVDTTFVHRVHLGTLDRYFDFLQEHGHRLFNTHKPHRPKTARERHHLTDPTRLITFYLVDNDNGIVATMSVKVALDSRNLYSWEISNILVRGDCEGRGLATRLFHEVEASFEENGRVVETWLRFDPENNALRHLYIDKWGFTEVSPGLGRKLKS